jgi:hypothetical protein
LFVSLGRNRPPHRTDSKQLGSGTAAERQPADSEEPMPGCSRGGCSDEAGLLSHGRVVCRGLVAVRPAGRFRSAAMASGDSPAVGWVNRRAV